MSINIIEHFSEIKDPRKIKVTHPLINIIFITVCAIIAGAGNFSQIIEYAEFKNEWLSKYLDVTNGIPSHDTFHRIFSLLDNDFFTQLFIEFAQHLSSEARGVIGLDGKTMRGTKKSGAANSAIHILNAYCVANHLCIGQMPMLEKSNEITAAPVLLDKLDIKGGIVTADALLCQQTIAAKIVEKQANYVLALKDNQLTLAADVSLYFTTQDKKAKVWNKSNQITTVEKGHGRVETRQYSGIDTTDWEMSPDWCTLRSIIRVNSTRHTAVSGVEEQETRYYISSLAIEQFAKAANAVRAHWAIENNLHWQLDVSLQEDAWQAKAGNIAANMALINKLALSLLKKETSRKASISSKRLGTALSEQYMEKVIFNYANSIR